jgi:hypothetical protein
LANAGDALVVRAIVIDDAGAARTATWTSAAAIDARFAFVRNQIAAMRRAGARVVTDFEIGYGARCGDQREQGERAQKPMFRRRAGRSVH